MPFCNDDSGCPASTRCINDVCLSSCVEDGCPDGTVCADDYCVPACADDSDCPFGICADGICNASQVLFKMRKGHAQIGGSPVYTDYVAAVRDGVGISSSCSGNADVVLTLSDTTNAHVSRDSFDYAVCLHSDVANPRVRCRFSEGPCERGFDEIARVSKENNAHVLPPYRLAEMVDYLEDSYSSIADETFTSSYVCDAIIDRWLYVCCQVPTDGDGDGYAPVEEGGDDCDDGDAEINPDAAEDPSDRVDNNCNGLVDENVDADGDGYYDVYSYDGTTYRPDACPSESRPALTTGYSYIVNGSGCSIAVNNNNLDGWQRSGGINAYVVKDPTAISTHKDSYRSLRVSGSGQLTYPVRINGGGREYAVSFWYKVESGSFDFPVEGSELVPRRTFNEPGWEHFTAIFRSPGGEGDSVDATLKWVSSGGSAVFYLDALQLEEAPEPTRFNLFKTADVGCCPFDFCWTGGLIAEHPSCIHDDFYEKNVSMPPIGWSLAEFGGNPDDASSFLDAPNGYRCINGSWEFARAKFTPLFDGAGYCLDDRQCFIGGSADAAIACVDSGEYRAYSGVGGDQALEYFYCHDGNWTTRTKEIALQMLSMANRSADNDYTIFCDRFDRSLNPDETLSYYRDFVGDNVVNLLTSGIANEFCVMVLNGQVIAGVSLNNIGINDTLEEGEEGCVKGGWACLTPGNCDPETECLLDVPPDFVTQRKSFLQMLKGPEANTYCDVVLSDPAFSDGNYHACDNRDVYYNPKLKSVIFSRVTDPPQDVPFEEVKTFIGVIFDYLKQVLRDILGIAGVPRPVSEMVQEEQLDFVRNAGSFDKLYIGYSPEGPGGNPRSIKAVRETRAFVREDVGVDYRTFISAEYRNYQTDICRGFFYRHNYPDLRRQMSKNDQIQCTPVILDDDEWLFSVYVEEPVFELSDDEADLRAVRIWKGASDTFWNDLTAKIRTQPSADLGGSGPAAPSFTTSPEDNPVAGSEMTFILESDEDERLIARTWDFGDGIMSSSAYNITTFHTYKDGGDYIVALWVMDDRFKISHVELPLSVGIGPAVAIREEQIGGGAVRLALEFAGGNPGYNVRIEWGDGSSDETTGIDSSEFLIEHTYDESEFGSHGSIRRHVNVVGSDRDGINFDRQKDIIIDK